AIGVGVSIGSSTAKNYIGWKPPYLQALINGQPPVNDLEAAAEVQAYVTGSRLSVTGTLSQYATATESIKADVSAVSAALAGGATAVAGSGAGVSAINKVKSKVYAYIASSTGNGIG